MLVGCVCDCAHTQRHAGMCWCVRSHVCGEEARAVWGCMAMGWRGGGVAAEAAGRTPASLLAPGAPLLSK